MSICLVVGGVFVSGCDSDSGGGADSSGDTGPGSDSDAATDSGNATEEFECDSVSQTLCSILTYDDGVPAIVRACLETGRTDVSRKIAGLPYSKVSGLAEAGGSWWTVNYEGYTNVLGRIDGSETLEYTEGYPTNAAADGGLTYGNGLLWLVGAFEETAGHYVRIVVQASIDGNNIDETRYDCGNACRCGGAAWANGDLIMTDNNLHSFVNLTPGSGLISVIDYPPEAPDYYHHLDFARGHLFVTNLEQSIVHKVSLDGTLIQEYTLTNLPDEGPSGYRISGIWCSGHEL
jgi:hypothetical protein